MTLLVVFIIIHGFRIVTVDEDPQSGSAFAMFATVDVGATRQVAASFPGAAPIRLDIPADLHELETRLAEVPSESAARQLARELLDRSWELAGDTAREGSDTTLDRVRVEVVGLRADDWSLSRHVLVDVVVDRPRA